ERLGRGRCDSGAAAMRILRARRIVAIAADGHDREIYAQSRAHDSRHRAHDARCAQQSLQPSRRRRAGEQQTESLRHDHPAQRAGSQRRVPIEYLRPNPRNPRRNFPEAELDELAASIKERGIIQPVVVRSVRGAKDAYEIIAGERRWRAAQRAALHEIPIVPLEASDSEALELAIIENVQRTDLNPLEEGAG